MERKPLRIETLKPEAFCALIQDISNYEVDGIELFEDCLSDNFLRGYVGVTDPWNTVSLVQVEHGYFGPEIGIRYAYISACITLPGEREKGYMSHMLKGVIDSLIQENYTIGIEPVNSHILKILTKLSKHQKDRLIVFCDPSRYNSTQEIHVGSGLVFASRELD